MVSALSPSSMPMRNRNGPAIVVIPLGLSILAPEFAWARRDQLSPRERAYLTALAGYRLRLTRPPGTRVEGRGLLASEWGTS